MSTVTSEREAMDINPTEPTMEKPRSRRVGMANAPSDYQLPSLIHDSASPPLSATPHIPVTPPLPIRSPLRPSSRSISGSTVPGPTTKARPQAFIRPSTPPPLDLDDFAAIAEAAIPEPFHMRNRSFPTLNGLLDSVSTKSDEGVLTSKTLPLRPDSPLSLSLMDDEPASSTSSLAQQPAMTKRQHALHELLSSERAYASDLALIREVHIPLALGNDALLSSDPRGLTTVLSGQTVPLHATPISPPNSSASSSRTLSTSSDSSTASLGPPMTQEDTKIIFSNIAELAVFSDLFCEGLEEALGSIVEGGEGEDYVGALFLKVVSDSTYLLLMSSCQHL